MLNKMQIIGFLGKDPESRYLPSGEAISNFSIATTERWKDKASGEQREATEWHRCSVFGRLAEVCNEYLRKGSLVFVEGKLKTRKWQDRDGIDRYTTDVHLYEMKMLPNGKRDDGGEQREQRPASSAPAPRPAPSGGIGSGGHAPGSFDDFADDIPFISCSMDHDTESRLARRMRRYV
jgi:single-strand DNA-binding protein